MDILKEFDLQNEKKPIVCIAGAGGKTTLLYKLCDAFAKKGAKTAAFTTTHILRPKETDQMACIIDDNVCMAEADFAHGKIVIAGTLQDDNKMSAPADNMLEFMMNNADAIVAEADGSRCLPIKFPSNAEPCLVNGVTHLFVIAGLSALGQPLCEACHRWPLAMAACDFKGQQTQVSPQMMAQILYNGYGALNPVFVLNQADNEETAENGLLVKEELLRLGAKNCIIISLQEEKIW